jgi:PAS domain S-box-containing protein
MLKKHVRPLFMALQRPPIRHRRRGLYEKRAATLTFAAGWRREAARELAQSEERFRLGAQATKDAIWDWNLGTNRVWRSEMFEALFGRTDTDDDTYESWQYRVHPEDLERVASRVFAALQSGDASWDEQYRFLRADGTFAYVHERAYIVRDRHGKPVRMVGAMADISAAREAEQHRSTIEGLIARAAAEWRGTFDSVDTPILLLDEEGNVVRVNRTAAEWLGGFQQVLGMPVAEVGGGRLAEAVRAREDEGAKSVIRTLTDDTGRIWSIRVTGREHDATDRVATVVVAWQITEVLALQQSLERSERLAAMGSLVGGVAHEVRNPLFGISAMVDAHEPLLDEKGMGAFVLTLREQVDRLTQLMADLLEYGKPPRFAFSPVDLRSLLTHAIRTVRTHCAERGVRIETAAPETVPPVQADSARILQVIENLLKNAVDYTAPGGTVFVTIDVAGDTVTCAVRDSGPGFEAADLPRVFDPFFTKRRGGTGLGLAIAQKIVEAHGGRIDAANGSEGGGIVSFTLERASSAEIAE